jgi:hypothetical protein
MCQEIRRSWWRALTDSEPSHACSSRHGGVLDASEQKEAKRRRTRQKRRDASTSADVSVVRLEQEGQEITDGSARSSTLMAVAIVPAMSTVQ